MPRTHLLDFLCVAPHLPLLVSSGHCSPVVTFSALTAAHSLAAPKLSAHGPHWVIAEALAFHWLLKVLFLSHTFP